MVFWDRFHSRLEAKTLVSRAHVRSAGENRVQDSLARFAEQRSKGRYSLATHFQCVAKLNHTPFCKAL